MSKQEIRGQSTESDRCAVWNLSVQPKDPLFYFILHVGIFFIWSIFIVSKYLC